MNITEWVETYLTKPAKVLIVDDAPFISEVIMAALKEYGCEFVCCFDGESAITHVQSTCFDIIFLDLMLPGVNGVEVLKKIKSVAPQTPVVFMTGYLDSSLLDEVFSLGIVTFMRKPFDLTPARVRQAFQVFKIRGFPAKSAFAHPPAYAVA